MRASDAQISASWFQTCKVLSRLVSIDAQILSVLVSNPQGAVQTGIKRDFYLWGGAHTVEYWHKWEPCGIDRCVLTQVMASPALARDDQEYAGLLCLGRQ